MIGKDEYKMMVHFSFLPASRHIDLEGLRSARALVKGNVPPSDYGLGKGLNKAQLNPTEPNGTQRKKGGGL